MSDEKIISNQEKSYPNWMGILSLVAVVIVTAAVVGGIMYWQLSKVVQTQESYIDSLKSQVESLSDKLQEVSGSGDTSCALDD